MSFFREVYARNRILANLGTAHFVLAALLLLYLPFNDTVVLGLNSVIKPIKFALSIGTYSYTMAWLLFYLTEQKKVRIYSWVAVVAMCFEQAAITIQALRGVKSHYNTQSASGIILFALMGVFIVTLVSWTVYITWLYLRQRSFAISPSYLLGIRIGLISFCFFSFFGSYMASTPAHTVGAPDGTAGLPFMNWSLHYGDMRVAHFIGIHALQMLPLLGYFSGKFLSQKKALATVGVISTLYIGFALTVMIQALDGKPFISY